MQASKRLLCSIFNNLSPYASTNAERVSIRVLTGMSSPREDGSGLVSPSSLHPRRQPSSSLNTA
jgi:hypothetical protein